MSRLALSTKVALLFFIIYVLFFKPTGNSLATAAIDCIIRIWSLEGKLICQECFVETFKGSQALLVFFVVCFFSV